MSQIPTNKTFDYIVVGGGSSGCIVAARLAQEANAEVLLLEAGPAAEANPDTMTADGFKYCFANDDVMRDRFSTIQPGLADRSIYQGTGWTSGGSGSVNGMVYTRGDKADFASWPKGWQWQDIEPAFAAIEQQLQPRPRAATEFTQAAIDASVNVGFTHKDGLNDGDLGGCMGHNDMNYRDDRRMSSYSGFIHGQSIPNLTVINNALTHKLILDQQQVVGVDVEVAGVRRTVSVRREVILTAGALESPKLLMLSGIGPAEELKKHRIPVVLEQSAVGGNLHDHPNVCMFYQGRQDIDFGYPQLYGFDRVNPDSDLLEGQPDTCFAFFSAPITLKQSMYRMVPALALPEKLYKFKLLRQFFRRLIDVAFLVPKLNKFINRMYGIVVILGKPVSRGRLSLKSSDARDQAQIDVAYFQNEQDMQTMAKGCLRAQEIASQASLKAWGNRSLVAGGKAKKYESLKSYLQKASMTTFHFCGTCKMGNDDDAVVNSDLTVKGIGGLRVADASVIPEIPVSAINAPSMMIGYRAADFILQELTEFDNKVAVNE